MTIDELIELATEAREDLGGDAQVRIAYQPGYPLRAALGFVTIPYSTDPDELYGPDEQAAGQQHDGTFLWLAAGDLPDQENPYAPGWAWLGSYFTSHRATLTASTAKPLASSPWAAAGSRAPAARLRDDPASRPQRGPRRSARGRTARPAAPQ